jgi:citronellol/citronellal dehydrogenase
MKAIKNNYAYVLKSIKKDRTLKPILQDLTGKSYLISGGTRGIGLSIGKNLASLGANVAIFGKTREEHPKLEGTIYTATNEILDERITSRSHVLGVYCDVRDPNTVSHCVSKVADEFGGLDGVILNASALCLNSTLNQEHKEIDLMSSVNINGTFIVGQQALKYIKDSSHGSVLTISPPLDMIDTDDWWINHLYYSMSKYNMSLMAKFWNKEFPNVGVNTLWPRTTIDTAPVRNILGGESMSNISRNTQIMGEAAKHILLADPLICNGKNFIDDEVLTSLDIDVEQYRVNKEISEKDLMPDFFC